MQYVAIAMEIATGNLAKSLNEIPEQIIQTYFCCNISAIKNKSRNTSLLILDGLVHYYIKGL